MVDQSLPWGRWSSARSWQVTERIWRRCGMTSEPTYGESALLTPANMLTASRLLVAPVFIYLIVFDRVSCGRRSSDFSPRCRILRRIVARRTGRRRRARFSTRWPTGHRPRLALRPDPRAPARPQRFHHSAVIITLREIWMSVFRSRAARRGISIPASKLAKWKTFTRTGRLPSVSYR